MTETPPAIDRLAITEAAIEQLTAAGADPVVVRYAEIPGFPHVTVPGHPGNFVIGALDGVRVGIAQGRFHYYEGYDPAAVVLPVRVLHGLGARCLLVTNAAGSLDARNGPGTLLAIRDHLNLQFANPLIGRPPGVRNLFPDMSRAYDPTLRSRLRELALAEGIGLKEGIYAGVLGPSYETPAEIRFLRRIGADAVGMSTVGEVIAAAEIGLPVAGVSLITNLAAGLTSRPLSHDDVTATAEARRGELSRLVCAFIRAA